MPEEEEKQGPKVFGKKQREEKVGGPLLFLFRSSILGLLRKAVGRLERWLKS